MEYICGVDREQTILLPDSIEDYIDDNNSTRVLDAYINNINLINMGFSNAEMKETGRPPYDPRDLLKLYVYGYMNRVRSSRRLETESKRNLEVLWLLRGLSPDHKTIARFRHDNPKALKNVFLNFVNLCLDWDLFGKELEAIDGSKFKAVNSRSRNFTEKQIQDKIKRITEKVEEYLKELETVDAEENISAVEKRPEEIKRIVEELKQHKERYQGYAKELEETGEKQKSLTDSDSRLMPSNGKMDVCYNVQTAVDAENKLVAEFEVTNHVNDKNQITPMVERVQEILENEHIQVVTDAGYESIQDILAAREKGVDVHVAGTDFDICVPTDDGEQMEITSHHNGRCIFKGN
jgi:transposase